MSDEPVSEPIARIVELTSDIVAAYVSQNAVVAGDLPMLIGTVHQALKAAASAGAASKPVAVSPAVAIKKSITDDFIICLEDGKKFKSLKRHLRAHYDLTPEAYRKKWGLPHNYPMVAPNYTAVRSLLAKKSGLGREGKAAKGRR